MKLCPQISATHEQKALREAAADLLHHAEVAEAGSWVEALLSLFPLRVFTVEFDGQGRILVNPHPTMEGAEGLPLWLELRRQGGDRVLPGEWKDGKAVIYSLEDLRKMEGIR